MTCIVRPNVAAKQIEAERGAKEGAPVVAGETGGDGAAGESGAPPLPGAVSGRAPRRFYGTVVLDPVRVVRDASRIADEVITHLVGLVGAQVTITLEVEAQVPAGVPEHIVRTVAENSRTLKFTSQGFEQD